MGTRGVPITGATSRPVAKRATGVRGFTVVEIALVLPIVGILIAVGASNMRQALAREEIDGVVRSMTYDIAAGRQAALTRRTTVSVAMTSHLANGAPANASPTIAGTIYTIGVSGGGTLRQQTLPSDISMTTTCPAGACSFDRRGVPITAGTITVTSSTTGRTYTITIEAGTGRVSFSEP